MKKALEFFDGDEFAASTFLNKYALRDKDGNILEKDPNQTILRVMKVLADAMPEEKTIPDFCGEKGEPTNLLSGPSEEWLKRVLKSDYQPARSDKQYTWLRIFIEACNKFKGVCPQGSILSAAGNKDFPQSLSNCFVIEPPHDSMAGIMRTGEQEAQLMKRRGGVGFCLSSLRPLHAEVANAARTSSGAVGWMEHFSNICRSVGMGARRGALMLTMDIKHPDAEEFAKIKRDLTKVTGANISLKISDEFMQAVYDNTSFTQQWPIDSESPIIKKEINASELWRTIIESAHSSGEPGLLMWTNCLKNLPANYYPSHVATATNPCGEVILSNYDSCRLTSICLTNYVESPFTSNAKFNLVKFEKDVRIAMRIMDAVINAEINSIDYILKKIIKDRENSDNKIEYDLEIDLWNKVKSACISGRRTGLGTHGLGDTLSQLCLKYDSDAAIKQVNKIYESLKLFAYDESVEMAKDYGSFPVYNFELEKECEFIKRLPEWLLTKIRKYGRRNISLLTNAPTGTISILSQVSSGIEPTFRQVYTRRRKINQNEQDARVDFIDSLGDKWTEFPIFEKNVQRYFLTTGLDLPTTITEDKLDELLPSYFVTSDKINWKKRVEIQSTAQQHIDHSIASTLNLPHNVTVEEVAEVYEHAHKMGLKGVTVYRDGCRSGVLISQETHKKQKEAGRPETLVRQEAPKRPKSLPCEVHITTVGKEEYVVIVSFLGDSIYEVFAGKHKNHLPEKKFSGEMIKQKEGIYILKYEHNKQVEEIDVNKYFKNDHYAALTRLVSTALRHGTPISFIVEQLMKSTNSFSGFDKSLARILKKYAKKEDLARKILANSGTDDIEVKFEDGCMTVVNHTKNTVDSKCD